jgi:uncharacterized protein YndB with AHSA1/START domain
MAEFELERPRPASAQRVFAVVSDLDRLPKWLPGAVHVRPSGEQTVHAEVPSRCVDAEGLVDVRPEQLRVEWGGGTRPPTRDYSDWLQVMHAPRGTPARC